VRLRIVEPELLDSLAPDDPRALKLRRDLKRANTLMMHPLIMARTLHKHWRGDSPRVLVDLGSGDGTFVLRVAQRLARHWRNVHVILLDARGIVSDETRAGFAALSWSVEPVRAHVQDFFSQMRTEPVDIVSANLFLHQLQDQDLANLLAQTAPKTKLFAACELRRTKLVRELGRMQWLIGAGDVICYDGVVSVRASFLGQEISALWPKQDGWDLSEYAVGPMTHVFTARRRAP
jgi:Methyltransferase domain